MSDHCNPAASLTGRGVVVSCTGEAPAARSSPPPTDVELLANVVNRPDPADSAPLQGLLQGIKTLGKMLQRAQCAPTTPSKCCAWVARTAPARPTRGTSKTTWTHSNNACQVRTCDPEPSAVTPLRVRACTHTRSWTPQKHLGGWEGSLDKRRLFCQAERQIGDVLENYFGVRVPDTGAFWLHHSLFGWFLVSDVVFDSRLLPGWLFSFPSDQLMLPKIELRKIVWGPR